MPAYLTPDELAARWRRSRRHVNRMAQQRRIPAVRIEGGWRFSLAAIEAYEAGHTTTVEPEQPAPTSAPREVPAATTVDGFTLPADYEPVFKDLWPLHKTKKSASAGG